MKFRAVVRRLSERMPADLRSLRARLMLEGECETLGVEEVACPACAGRGKLSRTRLERCPLCGGFGEVPDRLADWFRAQVSSIRSSRRCEAVAAATGEPVR